METLITILVVGGAAFWLLRWFRGAAGGKRRCSCGKCPVSDTCGSASKH